MGFQSGLGGLVIHDQPALQAISLSWLGWLVLALAAYQPAWHTTVHVCQKCSSIELGIVIEHFADL